MEDAEPLGADVSTANQLRVQATPNGATCMRGGPPSTSHLDRQTSLRISDKDRIRALDAMIVAIGIVAVLITNVAYVGYLTTPGGPDPYWLDCDYQAFVAYIYLNGFAMVFSTAAIAVVTFGPFLLMALSRASWRKQVVNVGLVHLLLSLLTLLAAFACAGFVVALVDPPDNKLCQSEVW